MQKFVLVLVNFFKFIKCIELILSQVFEKYGYSIFIVFVKEFYSFLDKNVLNDFFKYYFYNFGLGLMKNFKIAQKGIEYIECVV